MPTKLQKIIYWLENIVFFGIWGLFFYTLILIDIYGSWQGTTKFEPLLHIGAILYLTIGTLVLLYLYPQFKRAGIVRKAIYCLGSFLFLLLWDKLEYTSLDWAYYL